jgi:putative transcriptional regulator
MSKPLKSAKPGEKKPAARGARTAARGRRANDAAEAKGREIIASLTELAEALEARGPGADLERLTARTVEAPDAPGRYDGRRIRATRDRIGVSQAVFAQLLGVSAVLVASWEQGSRAPAPWARRLLDEANRDPGHWRGMVRKAS